MSSTPPQLFDSCRNVQLQGFTGRGATTTPGACSGSRGGTDAPHADETFDRVTRKIAEGEKIEDLGRYCYGVARFVLKEAVRKRFKEPVELNENARFPASNGDGLLEEQRETVERRLDCLEECLDKLADETRGFIIEYYREENGLKIEQRKLQAARLNTTLNALRLRASRLRRELGKCTDACLARSGDKYNKGIK